MMTDTATAKPLFFDLASFVDDFPLGDGTIAVHDESGAVVKVTGTTMANRNPLNNALYLSAEQLARLIQRDERQLKDYGLMHPGEHFCGACHTFHRHAEFTLLRGGRLDSICKAARSRIGREDYAAKRDQPIRHYEHRTDARPRTVGRAVHNKVS